MSPSRAVVTAKNAKKNRTTYEWACLDRILRDREKHKKKSEVYDWGKRLPDEKVKKKRNALRLTWEETQMFMKRDIQMPLGFGVIDPISIQMSRTLVKHLPFLEFELCFENEVRAELFISTIVDLRANDETFSLREVDTPGPPISNPDHATELLQGKDEKSMTLMTLETYMPSADDWNLTSDYWISDTSLGQYLSPLYRAILWSISNNFAGLAGYSLSKVLTCLRKETDVDFYRIVASSSCYAAKAIMRNLFKGAIEAGDASIVRSLLENTALKIDPDKKIYVHSNEPWTPIELASYLRHYDVIKVLLEYRVDVSKSQRIFGVKGALSNLILDKACGSHAEALRDTYRRPNLEVFNALLSATRDIDIDVVDAILQANDEELIFEIFRRFAKMKHTEWNCAGIFITAFHILDITLCKQLVEILVQVGADLAFSKAKFAFSKAKFAFSKDIYAFSNDVVALLKVLCARPRKYVESTIIDVAASRGDVSLIQMLLANGAGLTEGTLSFAVSSGVLGIVRYLLPMCAIDGFDKEARQTPLAAAISLQDADMMKLLEEHGAWDNISSKNQFASALSAASAVGDFEVLWRLVDTGGEVMPNNLGKALVVLAKEDYDEEALLLIDAGADINTVFKGWSAVQHALERRNQRLLLRLLDAGASSNPYNTSHDIWSATIESTPTPSTIHLAVEWGNVDIIERLILEGTSGVIWDFDGHCLSALIYAIKIQNTAIVDLLLKYGATVNPGFESSSYDTPLSVAARNGDMAMTKLLLEYGANPNDTAALTGADSLGFQSILDLLIEHHHKIHVRPVKGFGSSLLEAAVLQGDELRVKALLSAKMDAEAVISGEEGTYSPLGLAIKHDQLTRIKILEHFLNAGCDPNRVTAREYWPINSYANTALLLGVTTNDTSVVEILVRHGGNVNKPAIGAIKRTPIQIAAELGLEQMVRFLIRIGADVNSAPAHKDGGTALQLAASRGNVRVVKLLLDHGADIDGPISKVNGKSALENAADNGRLDTVKMLLNARQAQSAGWDQPQFDRAKRYATENDHLEVAEMLDDYEAEYMRGGQSRGFVEM